MQAQKLAEDNSTTSTEAERNDRNLTTFANFKNDEEQEFEEKMKWKDYSNFFSFSYGCLGIVSLFLVCFITAIAQILPSFWLSVWLQKDIDDQ